MEDNIKYKICKWVIQNEIVNIELYFTETNRMTTEKKIWIERKMAAAHCLCAANHLQFSGNNAGEKAVALKDRRQIAFGYQLRE